MTAVYYRASSKIGVCQWIQVGRFWSCTVMHKPAVAELVGHGETKTIAWQDLKDKINNKKLDELFLFTSLAPYNQQSAINPQIVRK